MLESLNYSFRNQKNIIWVIYLVKQLRNYKKKHGVLRGPQLGKQRWRARLGILRVKTGRNIEHCTWWPRCVLLLPVTLHRYKSGLLVSGSGCMKITRTHKMLRCCYIACLLHPGLIVTPPCYPWELRFVIQQHAGLHGYNSSWVVSEVTTVFPYLWSVCEWHQNLGYYRHYIAWFVSDVTTRVSMIMVGLWVASEHGISWSL